MVIFHVLLLFLVYLVLWAVGAFKVEAKWNASMEPGLDPSAKEQKMFDFGDFHFWVESVTTILWCIWSKFWIAYTNLFINSVFNHS